MQRLLALRRFVFSLVLTLLFGSAGLVCFDAQREVGMEMLSDHDYLPDVAELRRQEKVGEALAICRFVESQPGMPNRDSIVAQGRAIETEQASFRYKGSQFARGFVLGSVSSPEAMVGTVASDFLVVGDLRDFGTEAWHGVTGREVDKVVLSLSAVGIAATAASWAPEPAEPAAAAAAGGISLLKGLQKTHALTAGFSGELLKVAEEAKRTKKLGRLAEGAEELGALAKHSPAGTLSSTMKEVESLDDLKTVSRWAEAAPNATIVALHLNGKDAIEWMRADEKAAAGNLSRLLRKGAAGFTGVRPYLRGVKFFEHGRIQQIRDAVKDWLRGNPAVRKFLPASAAAAAILASLSAISCLVEIRTIFAGIGSLLKPASARRSRTSAVRP